MNYFLNISNKGAQPTPRKNLGIAGRFHMGKSISIFFFNFFILFQKL